MRRITIIAITIAIAITTKRITTITVTITIAITITTITDSNNNNSSNNNNNNNNSSLYLIRETVAPLGFFGGWQNTYTLRYLGRLIWILGLWNGISCTLEQNIKVFLPPGNFSSDLDGSKILLRKTLEGRASPLSPLAGGPVEKDDIEKHID